MDSLEDGVSISNLNNEPVVQHNCFKNWIGRIVTFCPEGKYTNEKNLTVQFALGMTAILSVGTLLLGAVWIDSMDNTQKIIVASIGGVGAIGSVVGSALNCIVYKFQPS